MHLDLVWGSDAILDLAISNDLAFHIKWYINDPWDSDHLPIFVTIEVEANLITPTRKPTHLYSKKIDWSKFHMFLDSLG